MTSGRPGPGRPVLRYDRDDWARACPDIAGDRPLWLGFGHTVPNGDPPSPLADTTGLTAGCCSRP